MKHKPNPKLAVAYVRVSTGKQHLSPVAQREAIQRWATREGVDIVAWFEDDTSGGLALEKRAKLLEAITALSDLGAGVLVVAKRDRLARDTMSAAMIERLVARNGSRIVSAAGEGTSDDDPASQLMRSIIDAFAQYERLLIKHRTKTALAVKRARGERTGSVPIGYETAADQKTLVENELEQRCIKRALELNELGLSRRGIAQRLTDEGYRSRAGNGFEKKQIDRILQRNGRAA